MISHLRGKIHSKEITSGPADRLVLEVGDIGFELSVSRRTMTLIGQIGETATLHTALAIRETDWTIFGFATQDERQMFGLLQSVSGIGPKLALALVGTLGAQQLAEAVIAEDQKMICQTPGVGAKVAQRIILELKSKIDEWQKTRGSGVIDATRTQNEAGQEVRDILAGLGYTPTEIAHALKKARENSIEEDVEILVRYSLKVLGTTAAT
jgi:Holliday junction DNA helicase RuvA